MRTPPAYTIGRTPKGDWAVFEGREWFLYTESPTKEKAEEHLLEYLREWDKDHSEVVHV